MNVKKKLGLFRRGARAPLTLLLLVACAFWLGVGAQELPDIGGDLFGEDDDLADAAGQGTYKVLIVGPDGKTIEPERYVRGIPGQVSIRDFPKVFSLEGKALFVTGLTLDAGPDIGGGGNVKVYNKPPEGVLPLYNFASQCSMDLPPGRFRIQPFALDVQVNGHLAANHPALSVEGRTLKIHTVPVTFAAIEQGTGREVRLDGLVLKYRNFNLLEGIIPKEFVEMGARGFVPLTVYLPRGLSYYSNLGRFEITGKGEVKPEASARYAEGRFVKSVKPTRVKAGAFGKGYWIVSHARRRVFRRDETALFHVIASGAYPAAALPVLAKTGKGQCELGRLNMPAVDGADARRFLLEVGLLAPGKYEITVAHADARPFAIEVVDAQADTSVFLHSTACCNGADFTFDSAGLEVLGNAGIESVTALGHRGILGGPNRRPRVASSPYPVPPQDAPPELQRPVGEDELILEDMLRHGVGTIDYQVRRLGMSFEGLAYHHSYPPSVERMVRRTQIFGQEFEDYPAYLGLTYTWFPKLAGYHEGSVIGTDPLFGARMQALREIVKEQTGLTCPPWKELRGIEKSDPLRKRDLIDRWRDYRRAEQRLGWQESFRHYNEKLREVRPEFLCTTHDNAGHDGDKLLRYLGGAHDAMSFESYTDFGDWAMSSGFVVDWTHGNIPGKPVWLTVEGLQTNAAQCADAIYAFARGAEGLGVPMREPVQKRTNQKRSAIYRFIERYGPLASGFEPDRTVAVLSNELQGRTLYHAHALYSHLVRLGYAPIILSELSIEERKVPDGVRVILIPNLRLPFNEACEKKLAQFVAKGGKLVVVGENTVPLEGATKLEVPLKQLWDIGGFVARMEFWREFQMVRPHLQKLMSDLGFEPRCGASPEKALIVPMQSGGILYVAVIASSLEVPDVEFKPVEDVQVRVGQPVKVIDLITGEELKAENGRISLDLVSEPCAFLALLGDEIDAVVLHHPKQVTAGEQIELAAEVSPLSQLQRPTRAPVEYVLTDAAGVRRATFYRLSGEPVRYRTAANDAPGQYTVRATELLTGMTAEAKIAVHAPEAVKAAVATNPVHVLQAHRISLFMQRKGLVRVVVEDTQEEFLPEAERIVAALKKAGREAEVQRVGGSSFDTLWLRWFPGKPEERLLAKIDSGEVVGYRGNMRPHIDKTKRAHVPERGGWTDVAPNYILRTDVVLFSGGRLADSMNVMVRWLDTPNTPGKGRAAIGVALSPFWADREALTLVANDEGGRKLAVSRLLELIAARGKLEGEPAFADAPLGAADAQTAGRDRTPLERPLKDFVPPSLCSELIAADDGWAAAFIHGRVAILSPEGKATVIEQPAGDVGLTLARGGKLFCGDQKVLARHPGWHFPTAWGAVMKIADPAAGTLSEFQPPQKFSGASNVIHAWNHAFKASPDGRLFFAGIMGGGYALYDLEQKTAKAFHNPLDASRFYERVRAPLCATAVGFSPDGGFMAYSTATFPVGHGNMGQAWDMPFATCLTLVNLKTGQTVWRKDAERLQHHELAGQGRLAVAPGGRRVYLINFNHDAMAFGEDGRQLLHERMRGSEMGYMDRLPDPIRLELSRDAATVLFAGVGGILLTDADGAEVARAGVEYLCDACLAPDGSRFYACNVDGLVTCYSRASEELWNLQTDGENPRLAAREGALLVGEGMGNVLLVAPDGTVQRRIEVAEITPVELAPRQLSFEGPVLYEGPRTLAILKKHGAKRTTVWRPAEGGRELYGRTFRAAPEPLSLTAKGDGPFLIELIYRHEGVTRVSLEQGEKTRTFELDLPTPEYRAVYLPAVEGGDLKVTLQPGEGLQVAAFAVYAFKFPGVNSAYVRPVSSDLGGGGGLGGEPEGDLDTNLDVLDLDDSTSMAAKVRGKVKKCEVYSNSIDPDRVQGQYFKPAGGPLAAFDGQKFTDGNPRPWTGARAGSFSSKRGSRVVMDLTYRARPKLCVTYEKTLKQSQVVQGISVLGRLKGQFPAEQDTPDPEWATYMPSALDGVYPNDQFLNVFDLGEVKMDILAVYVYGGDGREHGLSEIELYD